MGKIHLRHGDYEIELEGNDQFIKKHLEQFYERLGGAIGTGATIRQRLSESIPSQGISKTPTPAEYYKSKGKVDGVSKILVFAKYLEQYENISEFTMKDINRVVKDARLSRNIHSQFFTNAVKQGLLRKQGQKYSLTLSAEETLASMKTSI